MTNHESARAFIRHWCFVIQWTFVIRH